MGLFDKLGGSKEVELSTQAGLLLSAMTMIGADGEIDDDEVAILQRMDRGNSTADDWNHAHKIWKKKSYVDCIALVAGVLDVEQQKVVLANLIDIAMADGSFDSDEEKLLEAYIEAFSVDMSFIESVVNVVAVKNQKLF